MFAGGKLWNFDWYRPHQWLCVIQDSPKNSLENESLKQTRPYSVREFREEVVHFIYLKFEKWWLFWIAELIISSTRGLFQPRVVYFKRYANFSRYHICHFHSSCKLLICANLCIDYFHKYLQNGVCYEPDFFCFLLLFHLCFLLYLPRLILYTEVVTPWDIGWIQQKKTWKYQILDTYPPLWISKNRFRFFQPRLWKILILAFKRVVIFNI